MARDNRDILYTPEQHTDTIINRNLDDIRRCLADVNRRLAELQSEINNLKGGK
jgi:hypothetical protein